jgi:cell division inhibitor SepF
VSNIFSRIGKFVGLDSQADEEFIYDDGVDEEFQDFYTSDEATTASDEQPHAQAPLLQTEVTSRPLTTMGLDTVNESMNAVNNVNNVVGMPGASKWWGGNAEVIVMEPRAFSEMPQVIQSLKDRKSVVLNLTMMNPEEAQRAVDFVAGATYTIDGHQERIGDSIFLFTPSCVQVSTQVGGISRDTRPAAPAAPKAAPAPAWAADPVFGRMAQ